MRSLLRSIAVCILATALSTQAQTSAPPCTGTEPNLPPFAGNDAVPWPPGAATIDVLANDRDPEGATLTISSVTPPASGGTVSLSGGVITFVPAAGAQSAVFTYTVSDGSLNASATVTVGGIGTTPGPPPFDFDVSCTGRDCQFRIVTSSAFSELRETRWVFGDGTSSPNAFRALTNAHTYASAGTFQTTLTLNYFSGATRSLTKNVVAGPLADVIEFDVLTSGADVGGLRVRAVINKVLLGSSANDILGWAYGIAWGDGTPQVPLAHFSGLTPVGSDELHVYATEATYRVTVFARKGTTVREFSKFVAVSNHPPVPRFSATVAADGRTVTFDPDRSWDDQEPGFALSHEWDFGDGTVQQGVVAEIAPGVPRLQPVTHTYTNGGAFNVKLSITDRQRAIGVAAEVLDLGDRTAPAADFWGRCRGRICTFESRSPDPASIVLYTWNFGDGSRTQSTTSPVITHEFPDGCFPVRLTVTGDGLAESSKTEMYALSGVLATQPDTVIVDAHYTPIAASNLNGILEPGETVKLEIVSQNPWNEAARIVSELTVESTGGGSVNLRDRSAGYGLEAFNFDLPGKALTDCWTGDEMDCYRLELPAAQPRPALHWDLTVRQDLQTLTPAHQLFPSRYRIHVGRTFNDVPVTSPSYPYIETLVHYGITNGCGNGAFCPSAAVTRDSAAFLLITAAAKKGRNPDDTIDDPGFTPPACTTPPFADVPCSNGFAPYIAELKLRGITNGCGNGNYCPAAGVTRAEIAPLLLRTLDPAMPLPACTGLFDDLPCTGSPKSWAAPWAEELVRRGVSIGCGTRAFCPDTVVTRESAAVLLSRTFNLRVPLAVCPAGTVPPQAPAMSVSAADEELQ